MAIIRTKSSKDQVWFCVDEELPFGFRIAPAPLPVLPPLPDPLPQYGTAECYRAPPHVQDAAWAVHVAEWHAMAEALTETALIAARAAAAA